MLKGVRFHYHWLLNLLVHAKLGRLSLVPLLWHLLVLNVVILWWILRKGSQILILAVTGRVVRLLLTLQLIYYIYVLISASHLVSYSILLYLEVGDFTSVHFHLFPCSEALLPESKQLLRFGIKQVHCFLENQVELGGNLDCIISVDAVVSNHGQDSEAWGEVLVTVHLVARVLACEVVSYRLDEMADCLPKALAECEDNTVLV